MKGAIASVEIFLFEAAAPDAALRSPMLRGKPRRLSLVIGTPERSPAGEAWQCRVALADLHRPQTCEGRDSIEALFLAVMHPAKVPSVFITFKRRSFCAASRDIT